MKVRLGEDLKTGRKFELDLQEHAQFRGYIPRDLALELGEEKHRGDVAIRVQVPRHLARPRHRRSETQFSVLGASILQRMLRWSYATYQNQSNSEVHH